MREIIEVETGKMISTEKGWHLNQLKIPVYNLTRAHSLIKMSRKNSLLGVMTENWRLERGCVYISGQSSLPEQKHEI